LRPAPRRFHWGVPALLALVAMAPASVPAFAQTDSVPGAQGAAAPAPARDKSPWLLAPVLNANPKLGASAGVMAGYIYYFDDKSRPSIFAITGQYTSTNS